LGFHLLVIDDNSPDGTGEILDKLQMTQSVIARSEATKQSRLEIIHRDKKLGLGTAYIQGFKWALQRDKKLGLGTAYIQGFKWALQRDFDCIFTMDADFSHNPDYLPDFLKKLADFDLVIGSRYVRGGGVKNWPVQRKLISRGGNFYAKTILRFPVNDCTTGFMGFRRAVLENINLDEINSEGYGFLIEMKYRTYKLAYKILEYPIFFTDRTLGKSKISKNIIWEAIFLVWKLKFKIR